MTRETVTHTKGSGAWLGFGAVLAVIGLLALIAALIYGNMINEEGGPVHGAIQAGLNIAGAIGLGVGVALVLVGVAKKRGPRR